jgi:hypothetical protein
MSTFAFILAYAALAGAVVSWFMGAYYYLQTLQASNSEVRWSLVFNWLFTAGRLKGLAAAHAAKVNKAIVAFIACVIVAAACFSLAMNLARSLR